MVLPESDRTVFMSKIIPLRKNDFEITVQYGICL